MVRVSCGVSYEEVKNGFSSTCRTPEQSHTWAFSTGSGAPVTVVILEAGLEKMIPTLSESSVLVRLYLSLPFVRFVCPYVLP